MVVPIDEVTHLTHTIEDLMDVVRQDVSPWPHSEFNQYVGWLRELANPSYDEQEVETVRAKGRQLQKELVANAKAE